MSYSARRLLHAVGIVQVASFLGAPIDPWARCAWRHIDFASSYQMRAAELHASVAHVSSAMDAVSLPADIADRVYAQHPFVRHWRLQLAQKLARAPDELQSAVVRYHMRAVAGQPMLPIHVAHFWEPASCSSAHQPEVQNMYDWPTGRQPSRYEPGFVSDFACHHTKLVQAVRKLHGPVPLALNLENFRDDNAAVTLHAAEQVLAELHPHAQVRQLFCCISDSAQEEKAEHDDMITNASLEAELDALQRFLAQHAQLQELHLRVCIDEAQHPIMHAMQPVLQRIASLSCLRSLSHSNHWLHVLPAPVQLWRSGLSQLTRVKIEGGSCRGNEVCFSDSCMHAMLQALSPALMAAASFGVNDGDDQVAAESVVSHIAKLTNLQELTLTVYHTGCDLGLSQISALERLTKLQMSIGEQAVASWQALASALPHLDQLQWLHLSHSVWGSAAMIIQQLERCHNLTRLDLPPRLPLYQSTPTTQVALDATKMVQALCQLRSLHCGSELLSSLGCASQSTFPDTTHLQELDLSIHACDSPCSNELCNAGPGWRQDCACALLQHAGGLTNLALRGSSLWQECPAWHVARTLPLPGLLDAAIKTGLQNLSVCDWYIDCNMMDALAMALKQMTQLRHVTVDCFTVLHGREESSIQGLASALCGLSALTCLQLRLFKWFSTSDEDKCRVQDYRADVLAVAEKIGSSLLQVICPDSQWFRVEEWQRAFSESER